MFEGLIKIGKIEEPEEVEKISEIRGQGRGWPQGIINILNRIKGGAGGIKSFAGKHPKSTIGAGVVGGGGLGYLMGKRWGRRKADNIGPGTAL